MDEWEVDMGKLTESTKRYEGHVELLETLRAEAEEYEGKIAVCTDSHVTHSYREL